MTPNLYAIALDSSAVVAALSFDDDLRFYEDEAPQDTPLPYVRWSTVYGQPFNKIDDAPDADGARVQFDIYADSTDSRRAIYEALRECFEQHGYIVGYQTGRDPDTRSYFATFDMTFITGR